MTEEVLPRQTGAEKAAEPCPICGGETVVATSPYGSTSAVCPACQDEAQARATQPQVASSQDLPRETGTDVLDATTDPQEPSDG